MKALRLPIPHPVRFWFAAGLRAVLRVRVRRGAPGRRKEPPGPGPFGPPEARSGWRPRGRGGISQVPRRSIPCLCPAPRPRPKPWSLTKAVPPMLPPRPTRRRLQRSHDLEAATGLQHPLPTLRMRRCRRPRKARFRLAGWPLPGEGRTLRIATKGFRAFSRHPPFQGLPCRKKGPRLLDLRRPARASGPSGGCSRDRALLALRLPEPRRTDFGDGPPRERGVFSVCRLCRDLIASADLLPRGLPDRGQHHSSAVKRSCSITVDFPLFSRETAF